MATFLGLGANLGDRLSTLQHAVDLLAAEPGITVLRTSRVWETDPVGGPQQPDFLNVVAEIETTLAAHRAPWGRQPRRGGARPHARRPLGPEDDRHRHPPDRRPHHRRRSIDRPAPPHAPESLRRHAPPRTAPRPRPPRPHPPPRDAPPRPTRPPGVPPTGSPVMTSSADVSQMRLARRNRREEVPQLRRAPLRVVRSDRQKGREPR